MRSSRSHNVDHENRRNDYHYHSSSRGQASHSESNGHGTNNNNNNEYRSSKRSNINSTSTNIIKRMKNSSLPSNENNTRSTRDHVNSKISKSPNNNSNFNLINIDQNECHQFTYNSYVQEEIEALADTNLDEKSTNDFDKFTKVTSSLRELIKKILENKIEKCQQKNEDNRILIKPDDTLSEIKNKGLMYFMEMKNLNRLDKHRLKEARKKIFLAKDKVDQIHLQLQNIQYEVMHLQKEQKTCASFRSKDETLELVEEQKFLISDHFPAELKHLLILSPDKTAVLLNRDLASSEELHKLHLARLDWELKQRISSDNKLKMAEESRYRLEVEISAKKRTLTQFDPTLKNVIESVKPLVSHLNVPLQVYNNNNNLLTSFLPQPLYVLYIQLCAYKSAFGLNYEVNIKGSIDEAQEFELKQKNEANIFLLMSNKTEDDDENGKHIDDDEDESEHRCKSKKSRYHSHHKSGDSSDLTSGNTYFNSETTNKNDFLRKYSKLLQNHPIKINLMFRYRQYQITCTFTFFPKLELIGLVYYIENFSSSNCSDELEFSVINYDSNIFSKLLSSHDTGYKCPNPTIEHLLRQYDIVSYSELLSEIGYTYDWAQRIAGIEYLNPDEKPLLSNSGIIKVKSSIAMDCLDKTVKLMIYRFQSRVNLQEQLQEIHVKKYINTDKFKSLLDSNEMFDNRNLSSKPKSFIQLFEKITADQLINGIVSYKKKNLIDYFEHEDDNDFSNDLFDHNNFIFKLVLKSVVESSNNEETTYEFHAFIIIPHNYPWRWPLFILSFVSDSKNESFFLYRSWIRTLEEHINVNLPRKVIQQAQRIDESLYSTTLLLRQIYDLQCGLDVIIEAREKYIEKTNNESMEIYSGPRCVNSFFSTSIVQGHDHSLKFI